MFDLVNDDDGLFLAMEKLDGVELGKSQDGDSRARDAVGAVVRCVYARDPTHTPETVARNDAAAQRLLDCASLAHGPRPRLR